MARLPASKTKDLFIEIKDTSGGSNTLVSPRRLDKKYAVESQNLVQSGDGIWKTRPGTTYYGLSISNEDEIDGASEYIKSDGTREIIAVGGTTGKIYKSSDGGSWAEITGATQTPGKVTFWLQINSRLYITNGTDTLCYYDGTEIKTYTPLNAPEAPTGALTTLTTGSYNNYYRIVEVNDIGYTEPSESLNMTTNKHRDQWVEGEKVTLTLPAHQENGSAYQIFWGEYDGEEVYLGTATGLEFVDDATAEPNTYIETPDDNTTGAPKFRAMEISGNRIWATYDPNNPYRVYFSGTGQYLGYFSPFYGGGYIDLEKGGRNKPVAVTHYRTGKGDPTITVLCSSPDGRGTIFQVDLTSMSIGETTFTVPIAYKIVGAIGADSPLGVSKVGDNVAFINQKGVSFLRNKEQMYNVLACDDMSAPIRPTWENLNFSRINSFIAYYKPPVLYLSVSQGSKNDKIILFDTERRNWAVYWDIGFKQLFEYTDNSGKTHFLGVASDGARLVEISDEIGSDLGQPFYQSYLSPLIPVSKDGTDKAKVGDTVFELGEFRGTVAVSVLGIEKDGVIKSLATKTKQSANVLSMSGWGDDLFSDMLFSDTGDYPHATAQPVTKIKLKVGKKVYATQYKVSSDSPGSYWELLGIQAKGIIIPGSAPSAWK